MGQQKTEKKEVMPMSMAWHIIDRQNKELICLLAGYERKDYIIIINSVWDYLPEEIRKQIIKTIQANQD